MENTRFNNFFSPKDVENEKTDAAVRQMLLENGKGSQLPNDKVTGRAYFKKQIDDFKVRNQPRGSRKTLRRFFVGDKVWVEDVNW